MSRLGTPAGERQLARRKTNLHGWISVPGRPRLSCMVGGPHDERQ